MTPIVLLAAPLVQRSARVAVVIGLLVVCVKLLTGCVTTPLPPGPPVALLATKGMGTDAGTIDGAFYQTLAGCQTVLTGFENQSTKLKWWGVGLQTAGGVFGSVLLPVAVVKHMAQSVVTLFGSLAGFASTEISVIRNEALDAAAILSQRASVLSAMQGALGEYYTARAVQPLDVAKLQVATQKLKVACITYYVASPNSTPIVDPTP